MAAELLEEMVLSQELKESEQVTDIKWLHPGHGRCCEQRQARGVVHGLDKRETGGQQWGARCVVRVPQARRGLGPAEPGLRVLNGEGRGERMFQGRTLSFVLTVCALETSLTSQARSGLRSRPVDELLMFRTSVT